MLKLFTKFMVVERQYLSSLLHANMGLYCELLGSYEIHM